MCILHKFEKVNTKGDSTNDDYFTVSLTSQSVGVIAANNPSRADLHSPRIASYLPFNRLKLLIRTVLPQVFPLAASFDDNCERGL